MTTGAVIEGRVVHASSNALKMSFEDGPDEPFATGLQGAADGRGKKIGVLFGFKNGGTGKHLVTFRTGRELVVESKDSQPSVFSRADGTAVATVTRGEQSVLNDAQGHPLLSFAPDPTEARTPELFRIVVSDGTGSPVADLDVIRTVAGWSLRRTADAAADLALWWDRPGQPLKVPLLGTRAMLHRNVSSAEREALVGACVDIAIGLRPYTSQMR